MTISKKRLYILVIGIVVGLAIIAGTTTAIVVTRPDSNAYMSIEDSVSIGNLLTDDGTGINATTYNALINKIGDLGTVNGTRTAQNINGGEPVIFQMGEINNNPIYWQVVFRTKDYITVWMCEPYSTAVYKSSTPYAAYVSSNLKNTVNNIYSTLSSSFTKISDIVATPNEMENDTGIKWQSINQANTIYSDSYTSTNNALTGAALDYQFWIPSHYEVCNTSVTVANENNTVAYTGLWGLNSTMRGFDGTVLSTNGSTSYCWLRSGSL